MLSVYLVSVIIRNAIRCIYQDGKLYAAPDQCGRLIWPSAGVHNVAVLLNRVQKPFHAIGEFATPTVRIFLVNLICELEDIVCMGRMSGDGFELDFLFRREALLEFLQGDC
jgi:hypothetical protein